MNRVRWNCLNEQKNIQSTFTKNNQHYCTNYVSETEGIAEKWNRGSKQ